MTFNSSKPTSGRGEAPNSGGRVTLAPPRLEWVAVSRYCDTVLVAAERLLHCSNEMMPRLSAIVTAWVRSLTPSLEKMLLTWPLTVSSDIAS